MWTLAAAFLTPDLGKRPGPKEGSGEWDVTGARWGRAPWRRQMETKGRRRHFVTCGAGGGGLAAHRAGPGLEGRGSWAFVGGCAGGEVARGSRQRRGAGNRVVPQAARPFNLWRLFFFSTPRFLKLPGFLSLGSSKAGIAAWAGWKGPMEEKKGTSCSSFSNKELIH